MWKSEAPRSPILGMLIRVLMVYGGLSCGLFPADHRLDAEDRWQGRLSNGQLVSGSEIANWADNKATPTMGGRAVLDVTTPFESLIDRQGRRLPPGPSIEFFGSDRISGTILGYQPAQDTGFEVLPAHLLVKPLAELSQPDHGGSAAIRVSTDWVCRVIRTPVTLHYVPATVWLPGGGQISYRSLRWQSDGVTLLTNTGLRTLAYHEIAEIHVPIQDEWDRYELLLATLTPDVQSRLMQVETQDGSRFTTSQERFQARHWGDRKRSDSWLQLLQPAWSLDSLWVRFPTIVSWRWFAPHEPPLAWATPHAVHREAILGSSWHWQRSRNVLGEPLVSAGQSAVDGFGVHGTTHLKFRVPSYTVAVRADCGLDPSVGTGGSVQARIVQGDGTTLAESPVLVGSQSRTSFGWQALRRPTTSNESPTLELRTDMLRDTYPAGSDPFDIRDVHNWSEPQLQLNREQLQAAVAARKLTPIAGLQGWTVQPSSAGALKTQNLLDETDHRALHYRLVWTAAGPFISLSRSLKVTSRDRWLSILLNRFDGSTKPATVQVKIDGRSTGEWEIPLRQGPIDPLPISVPLAGGPDRPLRVELIFYGRPATSGQTPPPQWWDLRGILASPELPGFKVLADDGPLEWLPDQNLVAVDHEQPFHGTAAYRLLTGNWEVPRAEALTATVSEYPRLGEFRLLTFAWRGQESPGFRLSLAHDGHLGQEIAQGLGLEVGLRGGPARNGRGRAHRLEDRGLKYGFRYELGPLPSDNPPPLRISKTVPSEWKLEVRDLYDDFGTLQLTGLGVDVPKDGRLWLDAVVLARTRNDVELLRKRYGLAATIGTDATHLQIVTQRDDWGPAIADFAPEFASADVSNGLFQKREHQGQAGGWQTHPLAKDRPLVLRTVHKFPTDTAQELDVLVSNQPGSDFLLQVRVNGEQIYERLVDDALTQPQRGYASLQIDLSRWQGETALVEVCNASNNWSNEHAVWKRLQFRERSVAGANSKP